MRRSIFEFLNKHFSFFTFILIFIGMSRPFWNHLNVDVRIFQAASNAAINFDGSFLDKLFLTWELKPFGNRLFHLCLHTVTSKLVSYSNKVEFELVLLFTYSILQILICYFSSALIFKSKIFNQSNSPSFSNLFTFLYAPFVLTAVTNILQAEEISLLFAILSFSAVLYVVKSKLPNLKFLLCGFVVSILLTWVFFIKLVTLSYIGIIFVAVFYLTQNRKTFWVLSQFFIIAITVFLFLLYRNPPELHWWLESRMLQNFGTELNLKRILPVPILFFLRSATTTNMYFLLMVFWALKTFPKFFQHMTMQWKFSLFIVLIYLMALSPVIVQLHWFSNHYLFLILPFIVTGILYPEIITSMYRRSYFVLLLTIWLLIDTPLSSMLGAKFDSIRFQNLNGSYTFQMNEKHWNKMNQEVAPQIRALIPSKTEKVLYLGAGDFFYFLENPSVLRHFYPLPLARFPVYAQRGDRTLEESAIYKETISKILDGDYNYVVWTSWIKDESLPATVHSKFSKEFETVPILLENSNWNLRILRRRNASLN